jgi:uncharacterized Ntn-hydrolase superfamily protein
MSLRARASAALLAALALLVAFPAPASATWSVIAVDARTGRIVVASATCVPQARFAGFGRQGALGLMDIQAIVVPGVGVAAAQAGVDASRQNQWLIYRQLQAGTDPVEIIEMMKNDPAIERRQFGVVDMRGRSAGFSGRDNGSASLDIQSTVPQTSIHFSIQGNILASEDVVRLAVSAFVSAGPSLADRVMAAMEAADAAGGDRRCTCETEPVLEGVACEGKTSHVAYIAEVLASDSNKSSFNDGDYGMYIHVTDENIVPGENANKVRTLRMRYDAWKAAQSSG